MMHRFTFQITEKVLRDDIAVRIALFGRALCNAIFRQCFTVCTPQSLRNMRL